MYYSKERRVLGQQAGQGIVGTLVYEDQLEVSMSARDK
jgi:hypothetical protein